MNKPGARFGWVLLVCQVILSSWASTSEPPGSPGSGTPAWVPESLRPWIPWVLHGLEAQNAPPRWDDANQRRTIWPGRLQLEVTAAGARFALEVQVFAESWVPLPGDESLWPQEVVANGKPHPVVLRQQRPTVRLTPGQWRLEGSFRWRQIPLRMAVPTEIGLIELTLEGQRVSHPSWDGTGWLWFRAPPAPAEPQQQPDFLAADWFGVLEDGHPQWLRVEVQLSVAGRPREETVGTVLPEGWQLAQVRSPIPVLVDEQGRLRAQVRPGQWQVHLDAFRIGRKEELQFGSDARHPGGVVLIGLQANPAFRVVELEGGDQVDASQTRFPERWRGLPVYRWDTRRVLRIVERMRGQGSGPTRRLTLQREWWLDEDGRALTFRDVIAGNGQTLWRLDVAEGVELGSARLGEERLLLTRNPLTGRAGFELRVREFAAECVGRQPVRGPMSATGWMVSADELSGVLHLPVGWRLLALWGPDRVQGDWLRKWTLLDLFGVLIFDLAVRQLLGWRAGALALVAAVLAYHEPGAPRLVWWVVLVLLALLRLVRTARAELALRAAQAVALLWLGIALVPFVGRQLQQALYPQLEWVPGAGPSPVTTLPAAAAVKEPEAIQPRRRAVLPSAWRKVELGAAFEAAAPDRAADAGLAANLAQDLSARIQTGPGVPEWTWRRVEFQWNGPVQPDQTVRWWLIPRWLERCLSTLRALLLLWLALVLVRASGRSAASRPLGAVAPPQASRPAAGGSAAVVFTTLLLVLGGPRPLSASEFPPLDLLNQLRERLLAAPPAFPGAAEIPFATLTLTNRHLVLESRIEAAATCAVPLPARFAQWSPLRVTLDGAPVAALRREDNSLWVVVSPGVHHVRLEGFLAEVDEWVWSFLLRPRRVAVQAPGWTLTGIDPEGVPQSQVFFQRVAAEPGARARTAQSTAYDQQPLVPAFEVLRELELGLRWKVRTRVRRLSPPVRAATVAVPILPGEQILTGGITPKEGRVEVNLGPGQAEFSWESELAPVEVLVLEARADDTWAEQWRLLAGPVWNVAFEELAPVYEEGRDLAPVWRPWPGEKTRLRVSRPEPIPGATLTVRSVDHVTDVGHRLRTTRLRLRVVSSLGQDFVLELPQGAEIESVQRDGNSLPPQRVGHRLLVPVVPGEQEIMVSWKESEPLQSRIRASAVGLPVEAANVQQVVRLPTDRWVLGTRGPVLGPAVRFWAVLALAAVMAVILSRLKAGPLGHFGWFLLLVGLTQVPVWVAWLVVVWFAGLQLRGSWNLVEQRWWLADLFQVLLVFLTVMALAVLYMAVSAGLLGRVEMFITGNGSTTWEHRWFSPRTGPHLPLPEAWAVSLWWYRLAMLAWALWLAVSLLRWLRWGWIQFSTGGCWLWPPRRKPPATPPSLGASLASPTPPASGEQR
jgi:hypothetical protein